jgi:hypothetical protein
LYGIGQGFSLETSDYTINAEARKGAKADSVGLYTKQVGNKILAQLLPSRRAINVAPSDFQKQGFDVPSEHLQQVQYVQ